jgi:hypothetical protein
MATIIKRSDGGIAIQSDPPAGMSVAGEVAKFLESNPQFDYVSHRVIPNEAVPTDREYRDAFCDVTPEPVIDVDIEKAREIHKDKLRRMRKPLLAALDLEMAMAFRNPALQDEIEARRQTLRDVTADPAIVAASTIEELKAAVPAVLRDGEGKVAP